ncbi:MAG: LD-carboxypeptidase [Clostridia bacterium]|nr:LD-carboxypeptidase [Clostridia bacterium]
MIKTVAIVSLSHGTLGEGFARHELELGVSRLEKYGLKVKFMNNTLKSHDYLKAHPEKRAEDLLQAFADDEVDMILCAIGGDDTFRLLPYLFSDDELKKVVNKKIFLGFSDTTTNHFMLNRVGLSTFYGQSFLADLCELEDEMLPYTKKYFEELISTGTIKEITPSDIWYECRTDFSERQRGKKLLSHKDSKGFELLQGKSVFSGKIFGGCIETLFDMYEGEWYEESAVLCERYGILPTLKEWEGKILLLESSEMKIEPETYRRALQALKEKGIFDVISGIIVGKPADEVYYEEYKKALTDTVDNKYLPIVYNVNIGHALPRCIIPLGVNATVDIEKQRIVFE